MVIQTDLHYFLVGLQDCWKTGEGRRGGLGVLLLDERVENGLLAVLWTDEYHQDAPAHYQAQLPRVLCQLVLAVRISHVLNSAIQHELQQWVKALCGSLEFHPDGLIDVLGQV